VGVERAAIAKSLKLTPTGSHSLATSALQGGKFRFVIASPKGEAIQGGSLRILDCFVAIAPRNDERLTAISAYVARAKQVEGWRLWHKTRILP
jgi:hypothetical protein